MNKSQNKSAIYVVLLCLMLLAIKYTQGQLKELRDLEKSNGIKYEDTMVYYENVTEEEQNSTENYEVWIQGCIRGSVSYYEKEVKSTYDINFLGYVCTQAGKNLVSDDLDKEDLYLRGCTFGIGYGLAEKENKSQSENTSVEQIKGLAKKYCAD